MVQRRQNDGLALETREPFGVVGQRIGKHLHGNVAVERSVARTVDLAHAAFASRSPISYGPTRVPFRQCHRLLAHNVYDAIQRIEASRDPLQGLKDLGFSRPTAIQTEAIPPALEGRDLLASAMTGSGKTAAFLLPILHKLIGRQRGTTRALVLTPTRELAAQIHGDLTDLAVHTPITAAAVYGGVGMGPQEHAFRSGVDVIIGTPGRLLDHFRMPYARLAGLEFLVLDEADRMLDMGFLPDIRRILRHIPAKRQTMFFSATMPPPIADLSREMLRNPASIDVARPSTPATGITQAAYPVSQALKAALLVRMLRDGDIRDALVFTRTKHRANRLANHLAGENLSVERIHGKPIAGAADRGAGGIQKREVSRPGRHRHRGARHRRQPTRTRRELRRPWLARRLRAPRRPDGAGRGDRHGLHAGVAGRGRQLSRHRARDWAAACRG
jgi:hypothetical protein